MPGETILSDTDVAQGQLGSQSEGELFREALDSPTLEQFENPKLPKEPPVKAEQPDKQQERSRDDQGRFQKAEPKEAPEDQQEGRIPPHRLREESEARRRAEQQIAELQAKVAAYEAVRQQQQAPPKKLDIFDDPSAFIRQEMAPYFEQMKAEYRMNLERQSTENAQRFYGHETVDQAYNAMASGMRNSDPNAWATYHSAMGSHDPYGVITRWYVNQQTLGEIGEGGLDAYRQRVLEEAMRNPEYQRQVLQAARNGTTMQVNRPVQTSQPQSTPLPPSLSDVGAVVGEEGLLQDPPDEALFRAAVSAKRRPTLPGR